ncbi:MAG: SCO family protein [Anaerolineaceae bacterium]|nr:SCO family protein [Anaerolineaceae bacterium]MCB9101277.1 SCO family protein [Anaerolineales bacterium]
MITVKTRLGAIIIIGLALLWLVTGCRSTSGYDYKGAVLDPPTPLDDFELTDTKGRPFHLSDTDGEVTLIYFGYTFCPDVCPLTMWDVKTALADVPHKDQVNVVFISVDPERDTPAVLDRYLSAFGPEFIGLTGNWEKVEAILRPFGAYAEKEETGDLSAGYLVSHTARLYLINPKRELLLTYPFDVEPADLASDLNQLLNQDFSSNSS